jgi:hypothetical protein
VLPQEIYQLIQTVKGPTLAALYVFVFVPVAATYVFDLAPPDRGRLLKVFGPQAHDKGDCATVKLLVYGDSF